MMTIAAIRVRPATRLRNLVPTALLTQRPAAVWRSGWAFS